jgi:predicted outer membrane repeat protein
MHNEGGAPSLTACSFVENSAENGGGIYSFDGMPRIFRTSFIRNSASLYGGGVYNMDSSAALINVHFQGNDADLGGAVSIHGASSSPLIANAAMVGNRARFGAALESQGDNYVELKNVTFVDNEATQLGGGISAAMNSELYLANTILWENLPDQVDSCPVCPANITYSLVQGGCPLNSDCTGNLITTNPGFLRNPYPGTDGTWGTPDDDYGDLSLHLVSPAIDAGNNAILPPDLPDLDDDGNFAEPLPRDIRMEPRRHDVLFAADTGAGSAPRVDMGAYEVWTTFIHLPLVRR